MTSGLLPDAAARRRAGVVVPPAVTPVISLPVWLVFVGTVLLSVALRCCGIRRPVGVLGPGYAVPWCVPGRPEPAGVAAFRPPGGPREATSVAGCRPRPSVGVPLRDQRAWCSGVPGAGRELPRRGQSAARVPATTSPMARR